MSNCELINLPVLVSVLSQLTFNATFSSVQLKCNELMVLSRSYCRSWSNTKCAKSSDVGLIKVFLPPCILPWVVHMTADRSFAFDMQAYTQS